MVLLVILWSLAAMLLALLLGRLLGRAASHPRRPTDLWSDVTEHAAMPSCGPFSDFHGAFRALEQRGELIAKIALLHWIGGLTPAEIADRMQLELATVERSLHIARLRPSRSMTNYGSQSCLVDTTEGDASR